MYKPILGFLCILFYSASYSNDNGSTAAEVLTVKHYDGLLSSLQPSVSGKIMNSLTDKSNYKSIYAGNNGSISIKSQKDMVSGNLATTAFENTFSTNSSPLPGPINKNTTYELLSSSGAKEYFSEVAFIDSSTIVTISYSKKNAWLLLIDITSNPMHVTSRLCIPLPVCCQSAFSRNKEKFYIDPVTHKIIIPFNKTSESTDNAGNLTWKRSKSATPGLWIITPVKNEDKKWALDRSQISVNYFSNEGFCHKGKNAFRINTAHSDNTGNIWMSFTNGIAGVLPLMDGKSYGQQVVLYNFNKDASWYSDMQKNYKNILYSDLKGTVDEETNDTINLKKGIDRHPQAYSQQYMESARFRLYSNLEKEKNAQMDSGSYYENPETLLKYVHLELDDPMSKKKSKLVNYSGFKIHPFQTVQNSITSGNDNSVFIVTNLGLYKLSYYTKTNGIIVNWSTTYKNSFIKHEGQKTASSGTTPTFIEDRNEVVICDNDFPQINMQVMDAKTGSIKQRFSLFEYSYGSDCENAIAYSNNTIIVGNTFGNGSQLNDNDDIPAKGLMKFTTTGTGKWKSDIDWNRANNAIPANTAVPKISAADNRIYIYHQPAKDWQISAIPVSKANKISQVLFYLQPDFKDIPKMNLDNYRSNFTIGPRKSIYIGTANGLLRIMSE